VPSNGVGIQQLYCKHSILISSSYLATSSSQKTGYQKPSQHKCSFHAKHPENLICNNVIQVESYSMYWPTFNI